MPSNVREMREEVKQLKREVALLKIEVRTLTPLLGRTLRLVSRASGSEDFNVFVGSMQKAIMWVNRLRIALAALQAARMAAGDPLAWAMAGVGVIEIVADVIMEVQGS